MQQQIKNSVIIGFGCITIIGVIVLTAYWFSRSEITLNLGVVIGVWWWDINLDTSVYFPFCAKQNVSEIYLNASSLNSSVNTFIQDANNHNISVYYVQSDKNLIFNIVYLFFVYLLLPFIMVDATGCVPTLRCVFLHLDYQWLMRE